VKLIFKRNPDYYIKGLPYVDGIELQMTPDAAVFGFNMFGDALRDLLDPRLRGGS